MIEPKLEPKKLGNDQIVTLLKLVAKEMGTPEGLAAFATPDCRPRNRPGCGSTYWAARNSREPGRRV